MTEHLHLTCRCGAKLDVSGSWTTIGNQQRAFDKAHADCRSKPSAGLRRPGTRYLVSTPRNMPRGALGRRLEENPPPPPKPAPLPNPVERTLTRRSLRP